MAGRSARYRWMLPHSVRMTAASAAAFAASYALGLPEAVSATVTAIVVTQSNLGGSLRTAAEQIIGSMLGAGYAIAVVLALRPADAWSMAAALAIAIAPPALLAARSPGFRIAPITAAIVLLGGTGLYLSTLDLAGYRIFGIGLGSGIGLLVSVLVMPARASQSVIDTADRIVGLMAEQMEALAAGGDNCQEVLSSRAAATRENLIQLGAFVEEASHEGRARLAEVPDGKRLLRTLRRVRQDIDMLRRAAREGGSDALHESAAAAWKRAAESAAATLRAISEVFAGKGVAEDFDPLAPAVRHFRTAVEEMREAGVARTLSTAELGRLFGIGFALDQLRHDLGDLMEGAREVSRLNRSLP